MENENRIWSGIHADTYTSRLLFVLIEGEFDDIYIDQTTCKLIKKHGEEIDILLEFTGIECGKYKFIGDLHKIYDNPDMIVNHIDKFVKHDESWTEPKDKTGWERFDFIDDSGRPFQFMNQNHKWIKEAGYSYPNYNMPKDAAELYPLPNPIDSLKTLMRKFNVDFQQKNYAILRTERTEE
mgnify:CR=1 FL=1